MAALPNYAVGGHQRVLPCRARRLAQPLPAGQLSAAALSCRRSVARRLCPTASQDAGGATTITLERPSGAARKAAVPALAEDAVRFGFPKGSLQKSTQDLFQRAGFKVEISERGYFPRVDDEELQFVLFRSQEISRYVEDGVLDAGICGYDWIIENEADVVEVCELRYSKATANPARWVLAVPEASPVRCAADLAGTIVASELVNTTRRFFEERGVAVKKVEYSWGATEVKASLPGVGAIVDITETGSSLRANQLRVVDTILESTTRLIANRAAWQDPAKRAKIEDVALLLQGAIEGKKSVGVKMNLHRSRLPEVIASLPAAQSPTISPLLDTDYVAVEVVTDEATARRLLPQCKRNGATGILLYPLDVVVY